MSSLEDSDKVYISLHNGENENFSSIQKTSLAKPKGSIKNDYQTQLQHAQMSRIQGMHTGLIVTIVFFVLIVVILLAMLIFLIVTTSNGTWNFTSPTPESDGPLDKLKSISQTQAQFLNNPEPKNNTDEKDNNLTKLTPNPSTKTISKKNLHKNTPYPTKRIFNND